MPLFDAEGSMSGSTVTWTLTVPAETWARRQLIAALLLLCDTENWQTQGDGTDADIITAAAAFNVMLDDRAET